MYSTLTLPELIEKITVRKLTGSIFGIKLTSVFKKNMKFCYDNHCKHAKRLVRIHNGKIVNTITFLTKKNELLFSTGKNNCIVIFENQEHMTEIFSRMKIYSSYEIEKINRIDVIKLDINNLQTALN